jgi:tRNA nucleotidyltransferase (CCA-adding enzyme)
MKQGTLHRLALKASIAQLTRLSHACHAWANSMQGHLPAVWLHTEAQKLGVLNYPPTPFLQGKDLLKLGILPGPQLGQLLHKVFELQLDGELQDKNQAVKWAQKTILTCS